MLLWLYSVVFLGLRQEPLYTRDPFPCDDSNWKEHKGYS